MALARVTTWSAGQVLTATALNGEFDNIIQNVPTLIGTLTANLDCGGFSLINVALGTVGAPGLYFTGDSDTGIYRQAANVFGIAAGGVDSMRFGTVASGVNYLQATPSATGVGATLASAGSDTNVNLILDPQGSGNVTVADNAGIVPAAVSGTPAQHGLYAGNVPKGWIRFNGTGVISIDASFNVTSITDNGTGDYTVTWDRDFSTANYAISVTGDATARGAYTVALLAGSSQVRTADFNGTLTDAAIVTVTAIGGQ